MYSYCEILCQPVTYLAICWPVYRLFLLTLLIPEFLGQRLADFCYVEFFCIPLLQDFACWLQTDTNCSPLSASTQETVFSKKPCPLRSSILSNWLNPSFCRGFPCLSTTACLYKYQGVPISRDFNFDPCLRFDFWVPWSHTNATGRVRAMPFLNSLSGALVVVYTIILYQTVYQNTACFVWLCCFVVKKIVFVT